MVELCERTYNGNFQKWATNPKLKDDDVSLEYLRGESGFAHRLRHLPEEQIEVCEDFIDMWMKKEEEDDHE